MSKSKYTPSESYSLLLSNTQYLLERERDFLKDSENKLRYAQSSIEVSQRKIRDLEATINILRAHPGITYEIQ